MKEMSLLKKPDIVIDYKNIRLIDKSDMQIGTMDSLRKSVNLYKKLFFSFYKYVRAKCTSFVGVTK